jgi:hypothetical protein
MTNCRPISLITVFSKISQKATYIRLSHHLNTNNILVSHQYGFRKWMSTENAAFKPMYSNLLNKKCMLNKYTVIWQMVLNA